MTNHTTHSTSLNEASVRKTYIFTKYKFYKNSNSCGMGRKSCGMNKIKIVGTDATLYMPVITSWKDKALPTKQAFCCSIHLHFSQMWFIIEKRDFGEKILTNFPTNAILYIFLSDA